MDVLSVRNVYEDALRAKDKKAAIGADVTIENPEERNPYAQKADVTSNNKFLRRMKLQQKVRKKSTLYNEIIPETSKHGSWTLGAQLPISEYENFSSR